MGDDEIPPRQSMWLIGPMAAVAFGFAGLFWQIANLSNTFLSLREHAEYQASTRRELDSAKTAADRQVADLQKQVDVVTGLLRSQLEEKIKDLQSQIDQLRLKKDK